MADLKIQWETTTGSNTYTLSEGETCTFGREEENTITLPNEQVSRQHAQIVWEDEGFVLHNLSSKNPIGLHMEGETHILKPGDTLPLTADGVLLIKPYKLTLDRVGSGTDLTLQVECPNCQKINAGDAAFCKWCGQSLTGSQTVYIKR